MDPSVVSIHLIEMLYNISTILYKNSNNKSSISKHKMIHIENVYACSTLVRLYAYPMLA